MNDLDALEQAVCTNYAEDTPAAMLIDELLARTDATRAQAEHHVGTIRAVASGAFALAQATHLMRRDTTSGKWLAQAARRAAGLARENEEYTVLVVPGDAWPTLLTTSFGLMFRSQRWTITVGANWVIHHWKVRRDELARLRTIRKLRKLRGKKK